MTSPTTAAGTPAADPYRRWETLGSWSDQRTLERERLESRAKGTGTRGWPRERASLCVQGCRPVVLSAAPARMTLAGRNDDCAPFGAGCDDAGQARPRPASI